MELSIMTHSNKLADKGDFINLSGEQVSPYVLYVPQIYYFYAESVCSTASPLSTTRMEPVLTSGRPLETEFECPLFFLTSEVFVSL